MSDLTVREHTILRIEQRWWKYAGAKDQHIRDQLGLSPTRYYQVLNGLIDRPEALAAYPQLVNRLRRLRDRRRQARTAARRSA